MLYFKCLLFGVLSFLTVTTIQAGIVPQPHSSEGYTSTPLKLPRDWDVNKLEKLTHLVECIWKYTRNDITIVASLNIHNADGSLKEIRTIELIIPAGFNRGNRYKNDREDDLDKLKNVDDDFQDTLNKMQKDFGRAFRHDNIETKAAYQKLSSNWDTELELYISKDEAFYQDNDGAGYYIRDNIRRDDKKKLEEEFKKRFEDKYNNTLISVLIWDSDNKFLSKDSIVEPKVLVYVDEASEDADEEMMDSAMEALAKYALNDPDRIAKELSAAMSNKYPEYIWFVTKGQDETMENAKYDVFVKMTFDSLRVQDSALAYTVYGVKK